MSGYKTVAIILGIVGSILAVLAVLVYESWLTPALVDQLRRLLVVCRLRR